MVWFNDKQRGVRVGKANYLGLSVHCTSCGHNARIRRSIVLRLWGERTFARDIARDLRCRRCKAAAASIMVISDSRPEEWRASDKHGYWGHAPRADEVEPPEPE